MSDINNKPVMVDPIATHCRETHQPNVARTAAPSQFEYKETWFNNLTKDIALIYPGGKVITLKANPNISGAGRGLTIKRHYTWNQNVDFNASDLYFDKTEQPPVLRACDYIQDSLLPEHVFQKMLAAAENSGRRGQIKRGVVNLFLSEEVLVSNEYSIYVEELGVVITTPSNVENVLHPATVEAIALAQLMTIDKPIAVQLFANDPKGTEYSTRYVNINGHVITVPVISESGYESGVYQSIPYNDGGDDPSFKLVHYTFDEADEKLNLYKNKEAAKNHFGEMTEAVDAKIKEREEYYLELKRKTEIEHKRKIDEYKELAEKRKLETAELMEELDRRKAVRNDRYDSASTSRKTWTETIKWLPAIIGGIVTAVGLCFALLL